MFCSTLRQSRDSPMRAEMSSPRGQISAMAPRATAGSVARACVSRAKSRSMPSAGDQRRKGPLGEAPRKVRLKSPRTRSDPG